MPNALELLQQIERRDKGLSQSFRALLEAINEMHAKDNATIHKLHKELAKAKAMIHKLRQEWEIAKKGRDKALWELAEAKAEIGRLRPLAENWRLVLNMRQHSSLRCIAAAMGDTPAYYSAKTHLFAGAHTVFTSGSPVQALRAIQEVGDDTR